MQFIQARNYSPGRLKALRVIVWHDMEAPQGLLTAENVAHWFAGSSAPTASAHLCVDENSVVECVHEDDTAWHAPGANSDGYGVELAGYARQSADEWLAAPSRAMLDLAAKAVAPVMQRHGIPARWLTDAELADGRTKGMTTHAQVTRVFRLSTHTDPGAGFPATYVVTAVAAALGTPPAPKPPKPTPPAHHYAPLAVDGVFGRLTVEALQRKLGVDVDGIFGPNSKKALQRALHVTADGIVGPHTVRALQYRVGAHVDGIWGRHTTEHLQQYLNLHSHF
jgi:peptidoglycan hydrolase-like protein with peptidoglycan-binding domain